MSVLGNLREALSEVGWLMRQDVYKEDDPKKRQDRYIVYNVANETPSAFADNVPSEEVIYLQIHLYMPETFNPKSVKKQVKCLLCQAGFLYPQVTLDTLEEATSKRHICLETSITQKTEV